MPTYEFRCPDGHGFERFYRKISDAAMELPCPECGRPAIRHLSGGAGLLFKGSGFYLTDYGKNAHRKAAPSAPESSGSESTPSTGTPAAESASAKPEARPEKSKPAEVKSTDSKPSAKKSSSKPKSDG